MKAFGKKCLNCSEGVAELFQNSEVLLNVEKRRFVRAGGVYLLKSIRSISEDKKGQKGKSNET